MSKDVTKLNSKGADLYSDLQKQWQFLKVLTVSDI